MTTTTTDKAAELAALLRGGGSREDGRWPAAEVLSRDVYIAAQGAARLMVAALGRRPAGPDDIVLRQLQAVLSAIDAELGTNLAEEYRPIGWDNDRQLQVRLGYAFELMNAVVYDTAYKFAIGFWGLFDPADWPR